MSDKPLWKPWRYGWGEELRVAGLPALQAFHSSTKGEKFAYQFGDIRSKPIIETMDEAKALVEARVRYICERALIELEPPTVLACDVKCVKENKL